MWIVFKVSIEFVTILFLFCFGFLAPKACGILSSLSEVELAHPALEGEVLTTGPPGRSLLSWLRSQVLVAQWCLALCNPMDCSPPLSMRFSRQGYWSGLLFPSPGDLPNPGIKPGSPALQADSIPSEPQGSPLSWLSETIKLYFCCCRVEGNYLWLYISSVLCTVWVNGCLHSLSTFLQRTQWFYFLAIRKNLFLGWSKFPGNPLQPRGQSPSRADAQDLGWCRSVALPAQPKTSVLTTVGGQKQRELPPALGCLAREWHMSPRLSLLARTSQVALHSGKTVLSLCTQKEEKENQIFMSTSNVYPRQANNLAFLQTIILQIFAKRVFREVVEHCWVLKMKTNRSPLGSI